MRPRVLIFDGITCSSAHLEIGPALSDANRANQPSSVDVFERARHWRVISAGNGTSLGFP